MESRVSEIINIELKKKNQDTGGHFPREETVQKQGWVFQDMHFALFIILPNSDQRTIYVRLWRKRKVRGSIFKWQ